VFVPSSSERTDTPPLLQSLIKSFVKHLDDHEKKFGKPIEDRSLYLDAPWPKNVLQHVLSAYNERHSLIGSLTRSRTSLNFLSAANTPSLDRRRSISPNRPQSGSQSAYSTTKRGKLTKMQKYGSTSNLKLVSEKISGFSVFNHAEAVKRDPIMAYGDVPKETDPKRYKKLNRQSLSENLFKHMEEREKPDMRRSISQINLKQDVAMEAVMIDLPSLESDKYDTFKSTSTYGSISQDGSEEETRNFSRWGPTRGSNSYADNYTVPVSQLSTLNLKTTIAVDKEDLQDSNV
jgi:hypothetical protein